MERIDIRTDPEALTEFQRLICAAGARGDVNNRAMMWLLSSDYYVDGDTLYEVLGGDAKTINDSNGTTVPYAKWVMLQLWHAYKRDLPDGLVQGPTRWFDGRAQLPPVPEQSLNDNWRAKYQLTHFDAMGDLEKAMGVTQDCCVFVENEHDISPELAVYVRQNAMRRWPENVFGPRAAQYFPWIEEQS